MTLRIPALLVSLITSIGFAEQGDTYFISKPNMTEWTPPVEVVRELPAAVVKRVHVVEQGGRHVCIEECETPFEEPKVIARKIENVEPVELTTEEKALIEAHVAATQLQISATVYFEGEKPFTHIRLRCGDERIEAWSSMNFAEMVTGISHYKARGIEYFTFVGHGIERNISASEAGCPTHRDKLNKGKARFLIEGERDEDSIALEALRGLHKLYNQERAALLAAYEVRVANQEKARNWHAENPPKPKDITIRIWDRTPNRKTK